MPRYIYSRRIRGGQTMIVETAHDFLEWKQRVMTQFRFLYTKDEIEANGTAIRALEKQIPKKPIEEYDEYICPSCGHNVMNQCDNDYLFEHCYNCGQALDWDDYEK